MKLAERIALQAVADDGPLTVGVRISHKAAVNLERKGWVEHVNFYPKGPRAQKVMEAVRLTAAGADALERATTPTTC